jgi:hypothetical protein
MHFCTIFFVDTDRHWVSPTAELLLMSISTVGRYRNKSLYFRHSSDPIADLKLPDDDDATILLNDDAML